MIQLRADTGITSAKLKARFNPTLIQLRAGGAECRPFLTYVSIPPWSNCEPAKNRVDELEKIGFNPTLVQLRVYRLCSCSLGRYCFNPTLVQLRARVQKAIQGIRLVSIPPWSNCELDEYKKRNEAIVFQSHLGPIASLQLTLLLRMVNHGSIPPWSNCEYSCTPRYHSFSLVSIPPWSNCE